MKEPNKVSAATSEPAPGAGFLSALRRSPAETQMNYRENVLRSIRFERAEYIPMVFHINAACWHHYDQDALQDLMEEHRFLFPDFTRQEMVKPHYGMADSFGRNERKQRRWE